MSRCPTVEELEALLSDCLDGPMADDIEAHVETCAGCQKTLELLTVSADRRRDDDLMFSGGSGSDFLRQLERQPPEVHSESSDRKTAQSSPGRQGPLTKRFKVALVPSSGHGTDEIQSLLQRRLRFLATVTSAALLYPLAELLIRGSQLPPGMRARGAASLLVAVVVGLGGILWTWRTLSLRQLRAIELSYFGALFAFWAWVDTFVYTGLQLSEPPFWFAPLLLSRAVGLPWAFMMIVYGIFIPNTWRRCALVVGVMGIAPLVISVATSLAAENTMVHSRVDYVVALALWLGVAAAVATYGAHRIEVLRQEALSARRLGQYQLNERLGAGGMGEVYLAEHVLLRRPCAIKLIRPERAGDPTNLLRFEREVQATATLTHPNTVEIFDYGRADDGTFYYAMEYLPGLSLQELVLRCGALPPERAVHLLRQVCGALQEAHAAGLIHRDVKPGNVLVCQRGGQHDVAKLLDFGLVRAHGPVGDREQLTLEGAIAGTPAYMSPEQAAGKADVDARSDLYSLGAVAYFLLTGRPPFVRDSSVQILAAHLGEPVVAPDRYRPDVPADLQAVVLRCLEKDPARRFAEADEVAQALSRCHCANLWTREHSAAWWRDSAAGNRP